MAVCQAPEKASGDALFSSAIKDVHLSALAAVAATGAAFAQSTVTLSGKLAYGYEATKNWNTGAKTNGLRVTDGDFVLAVTEDLGGGLKASADMAVQSRGRGTGIEGRDAKISLAGGFGTVMIGAVEAGNGILGLGGAGAPTIGLDNNSFKAGTGAVTSLTYLANLGVLDAASNVDILQYTTPSMSGFSARAAWVEASNGAGGAEKTALTQDAMVLGASYAAGPLAASADFTKFNANGSTAANSPAILGAVAKNRVRVSASYDLGVAKLGAGYQTRKFDLPAEVDFGTNKQMVLGVAVPMGPFTFGYNYGLHKQDDLKFIGHDLGVNYALSKRTSVRVAYQSVSGKVEGEKIGETGTRTQVRLMHTF